jgi:SAM-dependent methyltransferase
LQLKTDHRTVRLVQGDREQSVWRKDQPDYLVHSYVQLCALAMLTWVGYAPKRKGRALIIGLGGGILCRFLRRHFPNVEIEACEPDAKVIAIAREHFALDAKVMVHCADGRAHMSGRTGKYDIVLLDAFDSTYVPASLMTYEFLQLVKQRLSPGGIFVSNTWVLPEITAHEDATYISVFGSAWDIRRRPNIDGNRILLINGAAVGSADALYDLLAARTAELDIRTKFHSTPRKPGERRMLSYSEMAERLAIRPVVMPEDGRLMNDMNIKRIRAQSSFDV